MGYPSIESYFKTLNAIQFTIRNSIHNSTQFTIQSVDKKDTLSLKVISKPQMGYPSIESCVKTQNANQFTIHNSIQVNSSQGKPIANSSQFISIQFNSIQVKSRQASSPYNSSQIKTTQLSIQINSRYNKVARKAPETPHKTPHHNMISPKSRTPIKVSRMTTQRR